jgi:uncharacterized protein
MSNGFQRIKSSLPIIGVGLGFRRELTNETFENSDKIDWLEFVPENYMGLGGLAKQRLEAAQSQFPLVSHGVNLSIGSADQLNEEYLRSLKDILDRTNSPWWSDHLCFASLEGRYMHDLLPMPFTKEAIKIVVERVKRVQDYTQRPFLLENISYYMQMPGSEMDDAQFLSEVVENADCGLLLDINNVYVNSVNHRFDPIEYLSKIPLDRTVQMHVAGHKEIGDYIIDTHGAPLIEPVYDLLRYVLRKTSVKGILLERDQNFPPFADLLSEIDMLKAIAAETQPQLVVQGRQKRDSKTVQLDTDQVKGGRDLRAISA